MLKLHDLNFPNESKEYRIARNQLLIAEKDLRKQIETVAVQRRKLAKGGKVKEDYVFDEMVNGKVKQTKLSELFAKSKTSLIIYSMMFHPNDDKPCPMCNSIVDGLDGQSPHVNDRVNMVIIAKAPIAKLHKWAEQKGWSKIHLLSSFHNSYNADYFAEDSDGNQMPMLNVFQKKGQETVHFYGTELLYVPSEKGQDGRHVDLIWPLWNLFDLTPEGRGNDWYPKYAYKNDRR